jgi:hypothetical protein
MRTRISTSWCRVISNAFRSCAFGLLTCTVLNQPTRIFSTNPRASRRSDLLGRTQQHRARMAGVETNYRKAHDSPHCRPWPAAQPGAHRAVLRARIARRVRNFARLRNRDEAILRPIASARRRNGCCRARRSRSQRDYCAGRGDTQRVDTSPSRSTICSAMLRAFKSASTCSDPRSSAQAAEIKVPRIVHQRLWKPLQPDAVTAAIGSSVRPRFPCGVPAWQRSDGREDEVLSHPPISPSPPGFKSYDAPPSAERRPARRGC